MKLGVLPSIGTIDAERVEDAVNAIKRVHMRDPWVQQDITLDKIHALLQSGKKPVLMPRQAWQAFLQIRADIESVMQQRASGSSSTSSDEHEVPVAQELSPQLLPKGITLDDAIHKAFETSTHFTPDTLARHVGIYNPEQKADILRMLDAIRKVSGAKKAFLERFKLYGPAVSEWRKQVPQQTPASNLQQDRQPEKADQEEAIIAEVLKEARLTANVFQRINGDIFSPEVSAALCTVLAKLVERRAAFQLFVKRYHIGARDLHIETAETIDVIDVGTTDTLEDDISADAADWEIQPTELLQLREVEDSDAKTRKIILDDINHFFASVTRAPLLSKQQESDLGYLIVDLRTDLRHTMLSHHFFQTKAVAIYRSLFDSEESLRITTYFNVPKHTTETQFAPGLSPSVNKMLILNTLNALEVEDRQSDETTETPSPEGIAVLERMLTVMPFRDEIFSELLQSGVDLQSRLAKATDENRDSLRQELVRETGETPSAFDGILEEIGALHAGLNTRRQKLVLANTRLCVSIAKNYRNKGIPFMDVIKEGILGAMRAVDLWDPSRGLKFSTYATHWIRQRITRSIANDKREIRLPVHINERLIHIHRYIGDYQQTYFEKPSCKQIADALDLAEADVSHALDMDRSLISLDNPLGEGETARMYFIAEGRECAPEDNAYDIQRRDAMQLALRSLPSRERLVLNLRYGLGFTEHIDPTKVPPLQLTFDPALYGRANTLEECAKVLKVTRERVRQIEAKALAKLQISDHPLRYALGMYERDRADEDEQNTLSTVRTLASGYHHPFHDTALTELAVPLRAINTFESEAIYTVGDYLSLTSQERGLIENIGPVLLREIDEAIEHLSAAWAKVQSKSANI